MLKCELSKWDGDPANCEWCNAPVVELPKRSELRWCSDKCWREQAEQHRWAMVRQVVMKNHPSCELCGKEATELWGLEVDHIVPIRGGGYAHWDCQNHQSNARTLCHWCHSNITKAQKLVVRGDKNFSLGCLKMDRHDLCWTKNLCACDCHLLPASVRPLDVS